MLFPFRMPGVRQVCRSAHDSVHEASPLLETFGDSVCNFVTRSINMERISGERSGVG